MNCPSGPTCRCSSENREKKETMRLALYKEVKKWSDICFYKLVKKKPTVTKAQINLRWWRSSTKRLWLVVAQWWNFRAKIAINQKQCTDLCRTTSSEYKFLRQTVGVSRTGEKLTEQRGTSFFSAEMNLYAKLLCNSITRDVKKWRCIGSKI